MTRLRINPDSKHAATKRKALRLAHKADAVPFDGTPDNARSVLRAWRKAPPWLKVIERGGQAFWVRTAECGKAKCKLCWSEA